MPDLPLIPRDVNDPDIAATLADLREITWAAIEDTMQYGTRKEQLDLIQKLAPYLFRDAAEKESGDDTTQRRLHEMTEIMVGLWGGKCPQCGHSYANVAVEELVDDEL